VRIGNRSRLFWTQGKSIFNKKTSSSTTDDSVKTEEKEALLSQTNTDMNEESPGLKINTETEIIELGKKISPFLTNLRKIIEEGKLFPNSRDWVDSALPILGNCIEIASQNKRKDLEQLFLDIARIIYSSDRVGKSHLSIEPALELYSLLCCVVADFMRGKPNKPMFEQWTKSYQKVVTDFTNSGIRLVDDNEEPIGTPVSETENLYLPADTSISYSPSDNTPPQDILPSAENIINSISVEETIEISHSEIPTTVEYNNIVEDATNTINDAIQSDNPSYTIDTIPYKMSEETEISTPLQTTDKIPDETKIQSSSEETIPFTESNIITTEQKVDMDIHSLIQQINKISQNEVKEILLDTLKAIVSGTHETAKAKAIELAKEMAKLEVEKVKIDFRSTEYQIESLTSEISQVQEQLNICHNEIKSIEEELKEQQFLTQKTETNKKTLEKDIENTQNKITEIEKKILELEQQKEKENTNLNQYKESLHTTEKMIEELNQTISSLKESIRDFENQAMTLLQRMDSLEKTKMEKETQLEQLQKQIKERGNTVRRLEETLRQIQTSEENISIENNSISNTLNTIDLFSREA